MKNNSSLKLQTSKFEEFQNRKMNNEISAACDQLFCDIYSAETHTQSEGKPHITSYNSSNNRSDRHTEKIHSKDGKCSLYSTINTFQHLIYQL